MSKDVPSIKWPILEVIKNNDGRDKFTDDFVDKLAVALKNFHTPLTPAEDAFITSLIKLLLKQNTTVKYDNETATLVENAVKEFLSPPELLEDELSSRYKILDAFEYRSPTVQEQRLVASTLPVRVRRPQDNLNEQLHLDLKKRALSFCHGAYILLQARNVTVAKQKEIMDKVLSAAEIFVNNMDKYIDQPEKLKIALAKLNNLITEMAVILTEPSKDIKAVASTHQELLNAEVLANSERRKPAVIVSKVGLANYQIETIEPNQFTDEQIKEINDEDQLWQKKLSPVQRYCLNQNKLKLIIGELATPSTLLGNMPGAANVTRYQLVAADGSVYTSIGRRTLAPMKVSDETTRLRLAKQNADQLLVMAKPDDTSRQFWKAGINIDPLMLEQSLLSPLQKWYIHFSEGFTGDDNNSAMLNAIDFALKDRKDVISSNWPVNAARMFSFGFDDERSQIAKDKFELYFKQIVKMLGIEGKDFTDKIKQAISAGSRGLRQFVTSDEQAERLLLAFKAYQSYRELFNDKSLRKNHADRNPEMFMACLERLMVDGTGGVISSGCKSAKDREGLVKMHTAAMIIYYKKNGELPNINDYEDKREVFAQVFTDVHHVGHQQHMANLNSYGAEGCQNGMANILQKAISVVKFFDPFNFFKFQPMIPEDLRKAVDLTLKREQCQDLIGRTNKMKFDPEHALTLVKYPRTYPQPSKPQGPGSHHKIASAGMASSTRSAIAAEPPGVKRVEYPSGRNNHSGQKTHTTQVPTIRPKT